MESKREQAMVGLFVLVAGAVLVATVIALTGAFGSAGATYRAYFPFAGGLEPGATVRYAGGPKVGRVEKSWTSMRSLQSSMTWRPRRSSFSSHSTIARARCK